MELQKLKALAEEVTQWSNCNQAWLDQSEDDPAAVVGHIDDDGNTYPVADPADGCYCISFSQADTFNPERDAMEWLEDHRKRFPSSQHAHYEVRRVMAQNSADMLMIEAAEEIERLRDAGKEAADVLRQEAAILRDCHTLDGEWDENEPEVKANYDGMIALADRLTPNA